MLQFKAFYVKCMLTDHGIGLFPLNTRIVNAQELIKTKKLSFLRKAFKMRL